MTKINTIQNRSLKDLLQAQQGKKEVAPVEYSMEIINAFHQEKTDLDFMQPTKVTFDQHSLKLINALALEMRNSAPESMKLTMPLFSTFIGENATSLVVDSAHQEIVVTSPPREGAVEAGGFQVNGVPTAEQDSVVRIPFVARKGEKRMGREIINFLMVMLPHMSHRFAQSAEYHTLVRMNLKSALIAKAKKRGQKERETVLIPAVTMPDVYVVKENQVMGKVIDYTYDDYLELVYIGKEVDGVETLVRNPAIRFRAAKDTRLEQLNSPHSLYQKNSGSLSIFRFAKAANKVAQTILVARDYQTNGVSSKIEEPLKALVMDELVSLDANGLPFGDSNGSVAKDIFSSLEIAHRENGEFEIGEDVSEDEVTEYKAYMKSMSQARSSGAVGFKSEEAVVMYYLGTGQDELAYAKDHDGKIEDEEGWKVMSVDKAFKRFMLGMSNGRKAEKGLLSRFGGKIKVKYYAAGSRGVRGEIKPEYFEIINSRNEVITIGIAEDFTAEIKKPQHFLVNRLDETGAFVGVEKFNHWTNASAKSEILLRNLTDGAGMVNKRVVDAAREAGILNSHDAFQLRISNAIKGAVYQHDDMCNLFGVDILLTRGMVKSEDILQDLRKNGFQMFVIGQRKDGADGAWIASQATQQFGMTKVELMNKVKESFLFTRQAIDNQFAADLLSMVNASEETSEGEFVAIDYLRMAEEFGDVLDEQYIKDEIVSLAVRKMNKVLDSKIFIPNARNRYMFTDPIAIYNAAKDGRYMVTKKDAVLKAYEVVAPSIKNGEFVMELGEALSVRFPLTISHEASVVTGVSPKSYEEHIQQGLWQGCTFFDAVSWVVAEQAGADHDGDGSALIFDKDVVAARKRLSATLFGGTEVLPLIDAYVQYNEKGKAVKFGTGAPTYVPEGVSAKKDLEMEDVNGFKVKGYNIYFKPYEFKGTGEKRRREFLEVVAGMSHRITINTIETSMIGMIANRAMVLTDLLSRTKPNGQSLLSQKEILSLQKDLLALCVAGRWEIDRPKHGGAYMEMPVMKELFDNFKAVKLTEEEMMLSDDQKRAELFNRKKHYGYIFGPSFKKNPVTNKWVIGGFRVEKPNWLASQKDEKGPVNEGSIFEDVLAYSEKCLVAMCKHYQVGHSNTTKNNIRGRIIANTETTPETAAMLEYYVRYIFDVYSVKEKARSDAERNFKMEKAEELKAEGKFGKKVLTKMTKAKKAAKIRKSYKQELSEFSVARDLFKAELRKEMYRLAGNLKLDVRQVVGALYLVVNGMKTTGSADHTRDGREYRFVPSNGFISIPFEVFTEEMTSLISGKVSETYFLPLDTNFAMIPTELIPGGVQVAAPTATPSSHQVKANVFEPKQGNVNKTVAVNRSFRAAVRAVEVKGSVRMVMYILKPSSQAQDPHEVTNEEVLFACNAPQVYSQQGIWNIQMQSVSFNEDGRVATLHFA